MAELTYTPLSYEDLTGWADDDHRAALDVFVQSCAVLDDPDLCAQAASATVARGFFEAHFQPVLITDGAPALFTGYYEPELDAALVPSDAHPYPLYAVPPDLTDASPYFTRQEIDAEGALTGRGLEIAWLADPVDVFFLQVQGSGRLRLPDGTTKRVGFGAKNGHPYTSIGKTLIALGVIDADAISPAAIRAWVHDNGKAGRAMLYENASYVFFRELTDLAAKDGPIGALGLSVTAGRTIAVDPAMTQLGLPVWLEKGGDEPLHRLMVAQDVGGAIKGAQRADIFYGTGDQAGTQAGRVKDVGRMVVLMPHATANALIKGDA
ncbi:MAG: murein transglycosylase A [Yoonia sp.]|uniref:murein transglycosylase A n=1 Tax=Yoonia sp. TaxID=2212373 RepID=UPI003EF0DA76